MSSGVQRLLLALPCDDPRLQGKVYERNDMRNTWKYGKYLLASSLVAFPLVLSPAANAQGYGHNHGNFSQGVQQGGRGGSYDQGHDYGHGNDGRGYDNGGYNGQYQGHGIGAGRGALIGGAGGAVLGAAFGGGLKGSIIGGAAGAGIGAVAGHEHQQSMKRNYYGYGH